MADEEVQEVDRGWMPVIKRTAIICASGAATAAAGTYLIPPALGVLGFKATGVAAMSYASAFQSAWGTPALFGAAQSAGATGAIAGSTKVLLSAVGGYVATWTGTGGRDRRASEAEPAELE